MTYISLFNFRFAASIVVAQVFCFLLDLSSGPQCWLGVGNVMPLTSFTDLLQ